MTEEQRNDLSKEEEKAFRLLRETHLHSIGDEDQIVNTLKKRGLIRSSVPQNWRWLIQSAAAIAVLAGTFFTGAKYGSYTSRQADPVVQPATEKTARTTMLVAGKLIFEDLSDLQDYRDEPDRPKEGDVLFAKILRRCFLCGQTPSPESILQIYPRLPSTERHDILQSAKTTLNLLTTAELLWYHHH